MNNVTN